MKSYQLTSFLKYLRKNMTVDKQFYFSENQELPIIITIGSTVATNNQSPVKNLFDSELSNYPVNVIFIEQGKHIHLLFHYPVKDFVKAIRNIARNQYETSNLTVVYPSISKCVTTVEIHKLEAYVHDEKYTSQLSKTSRIFFLRLNQAKEYEYGFSDPYSSTNKAEKANIFATIANDCIQKFNSFLLDIYNYLDEKDNRERYHSDKVTQFSILDFDGYTPYNNDVIEIKEVNYLMSNDLKITPTVSPKRFRSFKL